VTVAEIITILNNHGFEDTDTTEKMEAINDAYFDVCSRERWPFLEKEVDLAITATSADVTEPADLSKVIGVRIASVPVKLLPERYETLAASDPAMDETGVPQFYYFVGDALKIYPTPTSSYTARIFYERWPTELLSSDAESAILLPVRHHRVLVTGALFKLYLMEDDAELSTQFERHFESRIERMRVDLHQRQIDREEYIIDVDPENYESVQFGGG
jgi:hypothetical protein